MTIHLFSVQKILKHFKLWEAPNKLSQSRAMTSSVHDGSGIGGKSLLLAPAGQAMLIPQLEIKNTGLKIWYPNMAELLYK